MFQRAGLLTGLLLVWQCAADALHKYDIVMLNAGANQVEDAAVRYSGFTSIPAVLIPKAEKGQGGIEVPVPEVVMVVWKTADGHSHEQEVAVIGPRPFREMVVTINDTVAKVTLRE